MQISLDTNIWIFGIVSADQDCETILLNLEKFNVIVPDQIREEVERNLTDYDMKQFYRFLIQGEKLTLLYPKIVTSCGAYRQVIILR